MEFHIPHSLKVEHEALHDTLRRGTEEEGEVGAAAVVVAELMHPHFLKEEEYALPPLGLLADVGRGAVTPEMRDVLALTDKLKSGLGEMLAEDLKLHAQTEEDVMYPAAILIGEYVRLASNRA